MLQNQQQILQARKTQLTSLQGALKKVNADALALLDPRIYRGTQKATSSDATRVAASTTTGAGVGGYQVSVGQLANAAQRSFAFTAPAAAGTITVDGHDTQVKAGASVYDLADAINSDQAATVYAAATDAGTLVLSNRATGDTGPSFIAISGADGVLSGPSAARTPPTRSTGSTGGRAPTSSPARSPGSP
jgi:flagellar hook-associated protein 2